MNRTILLLTMLSISIYAADNDRAALNQALLRAVRTGNANEVRTLLNQSANIRVRSISENTVLHIAASWGYIDVMRELVGRCSLDDVNAKNDAGNTPLHKAANSGHSEIVKILLESGADTRAKNNEDKTPADIAQKYGSHDIVQCIRDYENFQDIKEPGCD